MQISMKCSVAIHCLLFIYLYGNDVKVTSELLSKSTGINAVSIRTILSSIKKDGIIHIKPGTGGATLNCPPEEISLYRLCRALEPEFLSGLFGIHTSPSSVCPVGANIHAVLNCTYDKIQNGVKELMEGFTFKDILSDYQRILGKNPV